MNAVPGGTIPTEQDVSGQSLDIHSHVLLLDEPPELLRERRDLVMKRNPRDARVMPMSMSGSARNAPNAVLVMPG